MSRAATRSRFPSPKDASPEGVVAVGGDFSTELLLDAYTHGIFPWPVDGVKEILWFSPPQRAVLFQENVKVSRSLDRWMRKNVDVEFFVTCNQAFQDVIIMCQKTHQKKSGGTWIRREMIDAYHSLHKNGNAFSVECRDKKGALVGGIYGVCIGAFFAGESMFHTEANASKLCLIKLMEILAHHGILWLDVQVLNEFTQSMGAVEVERDHYLKLLQKSVSRKITLKSLFMEK